ncbi:MAG: alpha/beta hydrolase [Treponema sp.]|nr:alpha/beta hydrolase [Treponema sp.]
MNLLNVNIFNVSILNAGIYAAIFLTIVSLFVFLLLVVLIFLNTTYRSPFKKRVRECTQKKNELQMSMFSEGVTWAEKFIEKREQLHIKNEGLNLYGEYINFGFDKCAVILQGRSEALLYSYYFAGVYARNEHNILVVDVRSQGLSDGLYQTGGIKESDDLILWIKHINEKYNIVDFTVHGICIGAATAVYAYNKLKKEGNVLLKRIVTDGLYKNYNEFFRAHAKVLKAPMLPVIYAAINAAFFLIFILAKVRPFRENPIKYMKDIDIPVLFICSTMDKFSTKSNSEELFKTCVSEYKEIYFFPKGRHSYVRASQKTEYDNLIAEFLQKYK